MLRMDSSGGYTPERESHEPAQIRMKCGVMTTTTISIRNGRALDSQVDVLMISRLVAEACRSSGVNAAADLPVHVSVGMRCAV